MMRQLCAEFVYIKKIEVDALIVITIFRGCFERCGSNKKTPHLLASMFSCLSICVLLFLLSSVCIAVGSTSLVCAVRSVSKTLAREVWVYG